MEKNLSRGSLRIKRSISESSFWIGFCERYSPCAPKCQCASDRKADAAGTMHQGVTKQSRQRREPWRGKRGKERCCKGKRSGRATGGGSACCSAGRARRGICTCRCPWRGRPGLGDRFSRAAGCGASPSAQGPATAPACSGTADSRRGAAALAPAASASLFPSGCALCPVGFPRPSDRVARR
eukprot:736164-Rhodomonas_salina.1